MDLKAFHVAEVGCRICHEVYGKKILRTLDTSEIYPDDWEECRRECDSAKLKEVELKIYRNSMYVRDNSLFILTNQGLVIKLNFITLELSRIPFEKIIPDKKLFNVPKLSRHYKQVRLPEKFVEPNLKDGRNLDQGIADLLGLSVIKGKDKELYWIYIDHLVIDRKGKCVRSDGRVQSQGVVDKKNSEKLNHWIKSQTFQTNWIPKGFDAYSFRCMVSLS